VKIISLQSGSRGNCLYVEAGGARLLVDSGISGKQARERLAALGRDIAGVDALLITHDHADHVSCAGIFQRRFDIPLYITEKTLRAANSWRDLGALHDVRHFRAGAELHIGGIRIESVPTPHDASDGVAFIIDDGTRRLGVFTDLGHVTGDLKSALATVDAAVLESNHDREMLESGPYPAALKRRIGGPGGHLSNLESAELAASCPRLRWLCLAHLSAENNTPEKALASHREVHGSSLELFVADRLCAGPEMGL
jgi:phosphoribosyl 1,2-cyclic phosphodiesterase